MGPGNLIRVRTSSLVGEVVTIAYVVYEQDAGRAIDIIKNRVAQRTDDVQAVSRVSEELLDALGVARGEFTRIDGRSRGSDE
jgi:hypothetical protein